MDLIKMNKDFKNCSCKREHLCPIEHIEIGSGVVSKITELTEAYKNILIVADDNTYEVCGKKITELIKEKTDKILILKADEKVVVPNEKSIKLIEDSLTHKTDLIIGIGSGVINDLCKYVSFMSNLPYYIIATAPSMDGYASVGAAMILKGMKVTVNARPPKAIIGDTSILKDAPFDMIQAGYGDIIGKFSCLNDWKLSALINNEYFCQKVYDETLDCANKMAELSQGIVKRDEHTIGVLMEALLKVGVLMSYVNSSRPASGSEHHLSHFFEITGILDKTPYFPHGIDVVYSSLYTQKVGEELLKINMPEFYTHLEDSEYEDIIRGIYGEISEEIFDLQNKMGWYKNNRFEKYKEKWDEIKNILREAPSYTVMEKYLNDVGLDLSDFNKLYGKEKIEKAIWFAKDLKDRYSVLWINFDLNFKK